MFKNIQKIKHVRRFEDFLNLNIRFVMAVRIYGRPSRITRLPFNGFETKMIVENIYKKCG